MHIEKEINLLLNNITAHLTVIIWILKQNQRFSKQKQILCFNIPEALYMLNIPHMHNIKKSENHKNFHSQSSLENPRKTSCT
jgi:hypothetical protein